jgi:hypothetical protein
MLSAEEVDKAAEIIIEAVKRLQFSADAAGLQIPDP